MYRSTSTLSKNEKSRFRLKLTLLSVKITEQIFMKLKPKELVTMRRTCSKINAFIEVNAKKFASRPALGVDLYFSNTSGFRFSQGPMRDVMKKGFNPIQLENAVLVNDDIAVRTSGVSIRSINASCQVNEPYIRNQLIKVLELLRPIINEWKIKPLQVDDVVPLTDCVTILSPCEFGYKDLKTGDPRLWTNADDVEVVFRKLKTARNRGMFRIPWKNWETYGSLFEKMKDFMDVQISITTGGSEVHYFLTEFRYCKQKFNLKRVHLQVSTAGVDQVQEGPPLKEYPFTDETVPSYTQLRTIPVSPPRPVFLYCNSVYFMILVDIRHADYKDRTTLIIKFAEKDANSLLQLIVETYLHYGRGNKEKLEQEFRPIVDDILQKKTSLRY